jgi:hypothetical protein
MALAMSRKRDSDPAPLPAAGWQEYIENKHATTLRRRQTEVDIDRLIATQSEIELVKYELVRDEGFRIHEPIVVYRGRTGKWYVVDGHTRARVLADQGGPTISAIVMTCSETGVDIELAGVALRVGGGNERPILEVPVVDRLERGSDKWNRRRQELKTKPDAP